LLIEEKEEEEKDLTYIKYFVHVFVCAVGKSLYLVISA
jgi:hypothetical protein